MHRSVLGLSVGLILGLGGIAQAKTAVIDFTGDTVVSQSLKQVNNGAGADGVTTPVKKAGKNVAATGGTDAARYLYLALDPAFRTGLKSVWVAVEYFDEGKGGFKLQYNGPDGADTTADSPVQRWKYDSQQFQRQVWHLPEPALDGSLPGGADIRIDDRGEDDADGPEFIAKVTVSDEDPDFIHFPYAVNKITIDGKIDAGEWDGALQEKLDRPHQDGFAGAPNWKGPEQFSGIYSMKYDENAFYIMGQVTDTTPRLNTTEDGLNYYAGDGLEPFLALDDSDPERTSRGDLDFHIFVGLGKTPGWSYGSSGDKVSMDPIGNNLAIVDTTGPVGYIFELQIPWKLLNNSSVKQGQRIAWYLFANNSTEDPSAQNIALSPAGRIGPSSNPSRWIRAVLDPKP